MGIGQSWATPENEENPGEKGLHISGTRDRGAKGLDFWMYNPPYTAPECRIRCGICKEDMEGFKHCPRCYPEEEANLIRDLPLLSVKGNQFSFRAEEAL